MWQFVAKVAAAKIMNSVSGGGGAGASQGSSVGSEVARELIGKNDTPDPPLWGGKPAATPAPAGAEPAAGSASPGVETGSAAAELAAKFDMVEWAANPGGMAKQKLGAYIGKGIKNAFTNAQ
jgi:hypothetical protein